MNAPTTQTSARPGPVITTHGLTKDYRHPFFTWVVKARALTDLSIEIQEGEVFGLLGPNGSGKSTAIKLILGLIFPSSGQISVFGHSAGHRSVKPRVGYLPEESYLYRFLNAEETLDFYGRLFGLSRKERRRRTSELLETVGLAHEGHRPVAEFSKGMQRRVALAQCLINRPDLIILDDPTSGMDPVGTAEIKQLILKWRDEGKTVLLCSPLLANVEDVCDRVSILCEGKQRVTGRLDSLIADDQLTRVTAAMDASTIEAVKSVIRERQGEDVPIDVSPPVERLEKFFLRIVQEARDAKSRPTRAGDSVETEETKQTEQTEQTDESSGTAACPGETAEGQNGA